MQDLKALNQSLSIGEKIRHTLQADIGLLSYEISLCFIFPLYCPVDQKERAVTEAIQARDGAIHQLESHNEKMEKLQQQQEKIIQQANVLTESAARLRAQVEKNSLLLEGFQQTSPKLPH